LKTARSLQREALARAACEPEDKRESTEKRREGTKWKKLALTAGKRGGMEGCSLAAREVESFSHISNNHSVPHPHPATFYSEN